MSFEDRLEEIGPSEEWSVSGYKSMEDCGFQWHQKYRAKTLVPIQTPPLAFGSAVHKCIERLHVEGDKWDDAQWQRMWNDEWYTYSQEVNWSNYRKGSFDNLGYSILSKYVDSNKDVVPLRNEWKFGGEESPTMLGRFKIKGIIDQIRRREDGRLMIVDFKTSKDEPEELMLRSDPQFTMYYHVVREAYGEEPVVYWYHLRTGRLIETKRNPKDIAFTQRLLTQAQRKVDAQMFERSPGYHCKFCPLKLECLTAVQQENDNV